MFDALKNSMFQEVDDVVWDLQSGQLGVKRGEDDEIITLRKKGTKYELVSNPLADFSVPVPAWAIRTPVDAIKTGDLVILPDDTWGFFLENVKTPALPPTNDPTTPPAPVSATSALSNPTIKMIDVSNGSQKTVNVASNALFGTPGLLVVRNIIGDSEVANSLPILMMIEGKKGGGDVGRLVAMSMMMQNNGEGGGKMDMQQMLPFMMMGGKDSKMKDFFLMQMMMGNKDGNGGGFNMNSLMPMLMMDKLGGDSNSGSSK